MPRKRLSVDGIDIILVSTLSDTVSFLTNELVISPFSLSLSDVFSDSSHYEIDFMDVKGQDHSENVCIEHISEAVQYRNLDRDLWK